MTIRFLPLEPIRTPRDVLRGICANVARKHGVTVEDLYSHDRTRAFAYARFEAWACLSAIGWSSAKIGRVFGRDHSTILHGLKKFHALAERAAA